MGLIRELLNELDAAEERGDLTTFGRTWYRVGYTVTGSAVVFGLIGRVGQEFGFLSDIDERIFEGPALLGIFAFVVMTLSLRSNRD